jgi:hypothetical protein
LRNFHGGGPDGSAWNWYENDFLCTVTMQIECEARIRVIVRVGEQKRIRVETVSKTRGEITAQVSVPWQLWEAELSQGDGSIDTFPYDTLLFVARVDGLCVPTEDEPSGHPFYFADSFVGGFSGGE